MPYDLEFSGDFFEIADFIALLDGQVGLKADGTPSVFGRLITIDEFTLDLGRSDASTPVGGAAASPELQAEFSVTTFLTPASEGATAGATPAGPAPAGTTPVSTTPTTPVPPTASVGTSIPSGDSR